MPDLPNTLNPADGWIHESDHDGPIMDFCVDAESGQSYVVPAVEIEDEPRAAFVGPDAD